MHATLSTNDTRFMGEVAFDCIWHRFYVTILQCTCVLIVVGALLNF